MTTPLIGTPFPGTTAAPLKKKRVLLLDVSPAKRELRADMMRRAGMEVDSAADIGEARSWWRADLYDLVLINVENKEGDRDRFCEDIAGATPRQKFAFLVGKPEYLADAPGLANAVSLQPTDVAEIQAAGSDGSHSATGNLSQRWGILEASRRISAVRSASVARTQAMRNRPAPARDPETRYSKYSSASRSLDELLGGEVQ